MIPWLEVIPYSVHQASNGFLVPDPQLPLSQKLSLKGHTKVEVVSKQQMEFSQLWTLMGTYQSIGSIKPQLALSWHSALKEYVEWLLLFPYSISRGHTKV